MFHILGGSNRIHEINLNDSMTQLSNNRDGAVLVSCHDHGKTDLFFFLFKSHEFHGDVVFYNRLRIETSIRDEWTLAHKKWQKTANNGHIIWNKRLFFNFFS